MERWIWFGIGVVGGCALDLNFGLVRSLAVCVLVYLAYDFLKMHRT